MRERFLNNGRTKVIKFIVFSFVRYMFVGTLNIEYIRKEGIYYHWVMFSSYNRLTEFVLFWMKSIHTYSSESAPVIIVWTHADKVENAVTIIPNTSS